jgi:hypothetical protein
MREARKATFRLWVDPDRVGRAVHDAPSVGVGDQGGDVPAADTAGDRDLIHPFGAESGWTVLSDYLVGRCPAVAQRRARVTELAEDDSGLPCRGGGP